MMTKEQLQELKDIILKKREEIIQQISQYNSQFAESIKDISGDNSSYSSHLADLGTASMDREISFFFASREGKFLKHLDEALNRIENGTYEGNCQVCGETIDFERLKLVPHASKCVNCKKKEERR